MESITHISEIKDTFSCVRTFSFDEKKSSFLDENKVNALLDTILDFKKTLQEKSERIYNICSRIEKLTWISDPNEESLMLINDLISAAKDLHSSLIRQYVLMNDLRKKGVAKEEIKDFKNSIDELKEIFSDLESVFFFLPKTPDFNEVTKELSIL